MLYKILCWLKNIFINILIKFNIFKNDSLAIKNSHKLKILIIRNDGIGDLILSIPCFNQIKKMYPYSNLSVLVNSYNRDIIKSIPTIDNIIVYEHCNKNFIEKLNNFKYDILICLYSTKNIYQLINKLHIETKIGPISKLASFYTFNYGVSQNRSLCLKNEAEYNLDLIKLLNPKLYQLNYKINTKLYYNDEHLNNINLFLEKHKIKNKRYIIIHPNNNKSCKNIKIDDYCDIIDNIIDNYRNLYIILTGTLNEKHNLMMIKNKIKYKNQIILFINTRSILNLVALIDKSSLFISTSTGPLHIASCLKKNIIGIYSKQKTTTPKRWGAFNNEQKTDYILLEHIKTPGLFFNDFNQACINKILIIIKNLNLVYH